MLIYSRRVIKVLLIFLFVVSMFSIVNIVSASLYVSHVEGSSGIKDFRKVNDTVSFNISSTSAITSINGAAPICQKESLKYYCAVTDTKNQATATYNVVNQEGDTVIASINVDNSIGAITYSLNNNNGNITLTYDVTDTGFNNNALCTGIDRIDVWWQGSNTDVIDFNSTICRQVGTRPLAISESGKAEFYLEVYDRIGNMKQSVKQNITIDVSTPEVSNLEVWNNGLPLSTIAPNTDFSVDITFDIAEDNLTSIVADLSDIVKGPLKVPYKNVVVPISSCTINNTEEGKIYHCTILSKTLNTNKQSVLINVTAKDGAGNTVKQQLEKTFTIDNVIPEVQITTDYCDEDDVCYVKNGVNKFTFQLTKDNFAKKLIYFDVGGVASRVMNCSGTECIGLANINCNGQVQIRILTVAPFASQDDSGNKLPYYSRTLKCDNSIPAITNVDWGSNSQLGENLLITGATVSLGVTVNEPDSKIIASAYFDLIKNETIPATCTESASGSGNIFNCTWSVSPIEDGYYDAKVIITAADVVNNSVSRTETVRILGFKSDNLTPTNLKASYSRTAPASLNRAVLQLAEFNGIPMYAYAYYSISVKQGTDVQLLSQELSVDNCVLRERDGDTVEASYLFSEIKLSDTYKGVGNDHRIDFTFTQSAGGYNAFADDTRVVCNVSARVREGKNVFKKPQILMIEIPFKLRNSQLDSPGEEYVNRIKSLEESTTDDYSSLIANLDKYMVVAQNFCTIKNTLDYAGMSGVAIQLAGMGLQFIPGMKNLQVVGGQGYTMFKDLESVFYDPVAAEDVVINPQQSKELPGMGILGQACTFMSCNLEWNTPLTLDQGLADNIEESVSFLPGNISGELTEGLTNSDLKNSLVMSAQKLCLPGVVYNLNKYRQMDCEYLECLKVYSASGLDVSQCEVMKASKTCAIIVGEAFELPYVRIGKNLFSNMADTVRMSYGHGLVFILGYIRDSGVCTDVTSDAAIISCNLPHSIQEYISGQKKTKMSGDFYYQETRDFCTSAKCVGPKCYPSNQLFGIPLPQFVPTRDQQTQMDMMKRFGPLSGDTYLLIQAHSSDDPTVREEKLKEWNTRVEKYNSNHNTEYPTIQNIGNLSGYSTTSNAMISAYFTRFGSTTGGPGNVSSEFNEQLQNDPTMRYKIAIEEYKQLMKRIEDNSLYIGTQTRWDAQNVIDNTPINNQKNYNKLLSVLPRINSQNNRIFDGDTNPGLNEYYYIENNVLYYKNGDNVAKVITYNSDGTPNTMHLDEMSKLNWTTNFTRGSVSLNKSFNNYLNSSSSRDSKLQNLSTAREEYRQYKLKEKATVLVNLLLNQLGMRKFLTAEYWSDKWGVGEYITEVADAVDPEIWKNNLCNPDNGPFIAGNDQPEGTVYSCYNNPGQGCKLVLTYGAESLDYGNNTNLYTITYLVGPVPRDTQFNIRLKGSSGTSSWFTQNKLLKAYSYDSNAVAILSKKKFDKVCVSFAGNFPDRGDSAQEFCRSIRADVFRTGKPVITETTPGYPSGNIGGGGPFSG